MERGSISPVMMDLVVLSVSLRSTSSLPPSVLTSSVFVPVLMISAMSSIFSITATVKLRIFGLFTIASKWGAFMARCFCRILVLTLIMALCFAMICPSSFADFQLADSPSGVSNSFNFSSNSFKSLMASILTACQITLESTLPVVAPPVDMLLNPFNITDSVLESIEYQYPWFNAGQSPRETLADYMAREGTIVVRDDDVLIDGKHYTDIWLDTDTAQAMRTNVLDLQTAWNIASNQSGILASGSGYVFGIPLYNTSSGLISQFYSAPYPGSYRIGNVPFSVSVTSSTSSRVDGTCVATFPGHQSESHTWATNPIYSTGFWVQDRTIRYSGYVGDYPSGYGWSPAVFPFSASDIVQQPFDYTFVSQEIPASVLDSGQGLSIRVPNDPSEWSDPSVQQYITNFNNNMTFSPNVEISLGDPGVMNTLDTLLTGLGDLILLLKPTLGPSPISPVDPSIIANTPWVRLQTRLDAIIAHLQSVIDAIVAQNNYLATFHATVISGFATIATAISSIASQIGDIGSSIVNGDKKWFKEVVDSIRAPFLPILQSLAGITGIWRYVVSWFGNISTPFTFFFSALGASGAYFLSPFYALAAGCIVIAIYRRFGK